MLSFLGGLAKDTGGCEFSTYFFPLCKRSIHSFFVCSSGEVVICESRVVFIMQAASTGHEEMESMPGMCICPRCLQNSLTPLRPI